MENNENLVAAIDIGTTKIVAIAGRKNPSGFLDILGISKTRSTGIKRGIVLNIDETVSSINKVKRDLESQIGEELNDVFIGIAGQHIRSIKNRGYIYIDNGEEINRGHVVQLLKDNYKIPLEAGERILHVIPQNYIVDNDSGIKNPVGILGKRLDGNFHIVLGRVASANNIEKCVNRVGLKMKKMILEPLASAEAVLTEEEKEAGCVLVDIGGGTTDMAVFYDGSVKHTAVIPFGGNVVTMDLKEGCSILFKQAEALKTQYGSALSSLAEEEKVVTIPGIDGWEPKEISFKSLAGIIEARMTEIIDTVMFQIESSGYLNKLGAGIVVTGGGSMLRNLPQLIKFKTGLDVRIGYPNKYISMKNNELVNHPMYSTSIGLILKSYDKSLDWDEEFERIHHNDKSEEPKVKNKVKEPRKIPRVEYATGDLFKNLKKKIGEIFDEKDVEM